MSYQHLENLSMPRRLLQRVRPFLPLFLLLLAIILTSCQEAEPEPLPPDEYLENALNWIESNGATINKIDWPVIRATAEAMAANPQTVTDTYPAIYYALEHLEDTQAFLNQPERPWNGGLGLEAVHPAGVVFQVNPDSPAEKAGIQVGDVIESVNGAPITARFYNSQVNLQGKNPYPIPVDLELNRNGEVIRVSLEPAEFDYEGQPTGRSIPLDGYTVAYLDLPWDGGSELYPTRAQEVLAAVDGAMNCGWIIDLRRNIGGDLWSYLAALGPILGEGELGGFVYPDGTEEMWTYRDGKVYWADEERFESYVRGPIYTVSRPGLPVALLVGPVTNAAPELVVVAFQEWGTMRTFGEPTAGSPHLILHTPLSDGSFLYLSGAVGMDRTGRVYDSPLIPDEQVMIDWQQLGTPGDPVLNAAQEWIAGQPECQ